MAAFYWLPANHNIRNFNKHAAVDLIRFAEKGISRTDLAESKGLTKAAVTVIVNDLISNGIILETESRTTSSGRPPVVLEINPKQGLVAAIDMGAMHLSVALGDFQLAFWKKWKHRFRLRMDLKNVYNKQIAYYRNFCKKEV